MTQYLSSKPFTVKTGQRTERDCEIKGHWPRLSRHGYECTFCGARCTVDGKSVEVEK